MKLNRIVKAILATAITAGSFFSVNYAQAQNDTIWGEGILHAKDNEGGNLSNQDILCTPYLMQGDTVPDTTWTFTTIGNGLAAFNLPIYIDIETKIFKQNYTSIDAVAFPNPGTDITLQFSGKAIGEINVYDLTGRKVIAIPPQHNPSRNISGGYLDLSEYSDGIYIIKAESEEGMLAKKIIKRGNRKVGNLFSTSPNFSRQKNAKNFTAEYIIEMNRAGFEPFKDTLTFTDGGNGLIDLIMQKLPTNDTIWGNGLFIVDDNNGTYIQNEDIFCTPVQMSGDTIPDTTYIFTTDNVGLTTFNLPVSINIAKKSSNKINNSNLIFKETSLLEASYAIHISHEGHYDFDDTISIIEGNNPIIFLEMEELPGIPQYQFIGGTFYNEEQEPLGGATVQIYDLGTNELLGEASSAIDGTYIFADSLATNTDFYFKAGGIEGKFSFVGDESSTPQIISTLEDTLKAVYNFTLYDKVRQVPGEPIGTTIEPTVSQIIGLHNGSNVEYSVRDSLLFYFTDEWTEADKEQLRNLLNNGEELFGMQGVFTEVDYELNQNGIFGYNPYSNPMIGEIGINIAPGGDNTSIYGTIATTPLGNSFYTTPAAEMTLSGNESSLYKEFFGRVFYFGEVISRPSFMNPYGNQPDHLDRGIAKMIYDHYINVFDNLTAYFRLESLADDISENKNTSTTYKLPFKEVPLLCSNK